MGYLSVLPSSSASWRFDLLRDDKINHIYITSGDNGDMMLMDEQSKDSGVCDSRAVYVPPSVVRISDLKQGKGQTSCEPGSGNTDYCHPGNSAHMCCDTNGNNASGSCTGTGSGVYKIP